MPVSHEPWLVVLSLIVAIQGAYVGLSLAVQIGAAEGLLWADAKTRFGEGLTERWYSDGDVAFPGGETGAATRTRGLATLQRFAASHPCRRIGVSTHGAMVRQLMKHALPPGATPAPVRNTTLFVLLYEPSANRLIVVEREDLDLDLA